MSEVSENVTIEITEPVQEVVEEPVQEVVEEPVQETVEEPVQEVVEEPVQEVVEEPVQEVAEEPVQQVIEEPVQEVVEEPVQEVIEEPVQEVAEEPVQETVEEPVQETVEEPVQEIVEEPVQEVIPKYIFIIPYRDREQQLKFFKKHMSFVLEDINPSDYKMFFIHQCDERSFNRGAMKNIGFLYVKNIYPNDYQNITLVFNDIDTMPYTKNFFDYDTIHGTVKHFYGFKYALGGIVSIKAGDFEKINGFPNFWAWGYEDNLLQKRVLNNGIFIDRTNFYPLMDKNVFQMKDGLERLVNRTEFDKFLGLTLEGISNIQNLSFEYDPDTNFVNIRNFNTGTEEIQTKSIPYDLTQGSKPFGNVFSGRRGRSRMGMHF
jgi:hypothetical protein